MLSKILLYEGPSPVDSVRLAGETTIQASTFDWYVPVVSPWGVYADVIKDTGFAQLAASGGKKPMMATGGVSIHLLAANPLAAAAEMRENKVPPSSIADYGPVPAMQVMGGPAPLGAVAHVFDDRTDLGDLVALADVSLDKAERRHVRTEDVSLAWQLDWKAERLEVRLSGKPENRPFQVHIVVEETVYSGEVAPDNIADPFSDQLLREQIHTPFVAEIVNQLVFVPEAFFEKERKAIVESAKMWYEFFRRFSELRPIGPGDPIEFLERSIREMAVRSPSTATIAATLERRVEFAMREAPELWEAVVAESPHG